MIADNGRGAKLVGLSRDDGTWKGIGEHATFNRLF
jgi:hypothetical protein